MSFILEALKKSEKKRQDGSAPKLENVLQSAAPAHSNKFRWRWWLALLVLNGAVLLWLFGPWRKPKNPVPAQVQTAAAPVESAAAGTNRTVAVQPTAPAPTPSPTPAPAPAPVSIPGLPVVLSVPPKEPTPPPVAQVAPAPPEKPSPPPVQVQPAAKIAPPPPANRAESVSSDPGQNAPANEILSLAQLPPAIRNDLPKLHISVHAYYRNEPAASLIRVNDQILRAGARLDNKYLLEEITAEGAIFQYSGYRFLVPRQTLHKK